PAADPILLELGTQPGLVQELPDATAITVQGGHVRVGWAADLNPPQFTLEAFCRAKWNRQVRGFYYTLLSSYSKQANAGYAVYGGPVDPNDPQSEYHWQVWVGTGAALEQLKVKPTGRPGDPGLRIEDADTYLVVTYDGTNKYRVYIYHSSPGAERDLDFLE